MPEFSTFVLAIHLGNEAMSSQHDIANALIKVGQSLRDYSQLRTPEIGDSGPIHDDNGNRVGSWHVQGRQS